MNSHHLSAAGLALGAAFLLSACAGLSPVSPQGTTDKPVFPEPSSASFKEGSWPNTDNLRQVQAGMNKNQLYNLIDRPHFKEGFGTHEWDYLFHFRTAQGERVCQYKILFDDAQKARSFFWKPQDCASVLDTPAPQVQVLRVPVAAQASPAVAVRQFSLSGDLAFDFGKDTVTNAGKTKVARIADALKDAPYTEVRVDGYTDRIGTDLANLDLSTRRAKAVRDQLVAEGVAPDKVVWAGRGAIQPLSSCGALQGEALRACLAPDRRVEVSAR